MAPGRGGCLFQVCHKFQQILYACGPRLTVFTATMHTPCTLTSPEMREDPGRLIRKILLSLDDSRKLGRVPSASEPSPVTPTPSFWRHWYRGLVSQTPQGELGLSPGSRGRPQRKQATLTSPAARIFGTASGPAHGALPHSLGGPGEGSPAHSTPPARRPM